MDEDDDMFYRLCRCLDEAGDIFAWSVIVFAVVYMFWQMFFRF